MHPVYLTALFTSVLATGTLGPLLRRITPAQHRAAIFSIWAGSLLMSPLAFYGVRAPLLLPWLSPWLEELADAGGWSRALADCVGLTLAPLTEEPFKLIPWLIALLVSTGLRLARGLVTPIAFALGLGFATGEMWLVAHLIAQANDPILRNLPWYSFGGYVGERMLTCFSHSLFALPTVWLARRGGLAALLGLLAGMSLHFLANAPIVLMARDVGGLGRPVWSVLVQIWTLGLAILGITLMTYAHAGPAMMRRVLRARMICPECGVEYRQPLLLGLNCILWRYERCAACRHWHWVSFPNLAPLPGADDQTPAEARSAQQVTS